MLFDPSLKKHASNIASDTKITARENNILSVIIRCHKEERISFLNEALFSLALQEWLHLEVIVVLQNGTQKFSDAAAQLIEKQPFHKSCRFQIHIVEVPLGFDGRSSLLNYGIKRATGRYLAFLDDDDVVYHHGYTTLINQLIKGEKAIAVGGCRRADVIEKFGSWYVQTKTTPFTWGSNRFDLFKDNFIPIHSYIIDQTRMDKDDLFFDDAFPPLEDYEFLLRIGAKYEFDFTKLNVFVCEYRIHGSNSLPYAADAKPETLEKYLSALKMINERKSSIPCEISISNLVDLLIVREKSSVINSADSVDSADSADSANLVQFSKPIEPENPQLIRKAFRTVENKIYDFFSRYPHLEKNMSKVVLFGWKKFVKPESGDSNSNNQLDNEPHL